MVRALVLKSIPEGPAHRPLRQAAQDWFAEHPREAVIVGGAIAGAVLGMMVAGVGLAIAGAARGGGRCPPTSRGQTAPSRTRRCCTR